MGPEKQNCKTRQPPIATNLLAHPPTHRPNQPSRTSLSTHDVLQQFSSKYSSTRVGTCRVDSSAVLEFLLFYNSPPLRGASDPSPGGRLSTPPACRVKHRRQFLRRGLRRLMCGAGVARSWCRGESGGARDSQLFFRCAVTKIFSKIHLDVTATTTEDHYKDNSTEAARLAAESANAAKMHLTSQTT